MEKMMKTPESAEQNSPFKIFKTIQTKTISPKFFYPLSLFLIFTFVTICGCDKNQKHSADTARPIEKSTEKTVAAALSSDVVEVSLAPFDVFPSEPNFGFAIRFSQPIVKKNGGRNDRPALNISPSVLGTSRWLSDSAIYFQPRDTISAGSKFEVDLSGLVLPPGKFLDKKKITVQFPEPYLEISRCEFRKVASDPVAKRLYVSVLLNYPLHNLWSSSIEFKTKWEEKIKALVSLNRIIAGEKKTVPIDVVLRDSSMQIDITGNEMLRPGADGSISFELAPGLTVVGGKNMSGANCEAAFLDVDWRTELSADLTNSEAKKQPVPAYITLFTKQGVYSNQGKDTLTVRFVNPQDKAIAVPHKRAAGEVLEKGLSIRPEIKGKWTVSKVDSELNFEPESEWLPGEPYTVSIDPTEFPELSLTQKESNFFAPYMRVNNGSIDSGTVPEDRSRRVVSTRLEFSNPIELEKLEKLLTVTVTEKGRKGSKVNAQFSLDKGDSPRIVYVRTNPLELKEYPLIIEMQAEGYLESSLGGKPSKISISHVYELPSLLDIFSVIGVDVSVAKSSTEELQRIVTVTTSEDVDEMQVTENLGVMLLPDCKEKSNVKICDKSESFYNEAQVTSEVEKVSEKLPVTFVSRSENGSQETFSFAFQAAGNRQILVSLEKGIKSKLGFPLAKKYREVVHLKDYPKRLNIMLDGALLSLSGSRRLGVLAQNVRKVRYRLSRVNANDLHHLVYVTAGDFKKPQFFSGFNYDDMAQPVEFIEQLPEVPSGKPAYTSVDFSRFIAKTDPAPRGLFYLEVNDADAPDEGYGYDNGYNPNCGEGAYSEGESVEGEGSEYEGYNNCEPNQEKEITKDGRLILLTDLGLVVKRELSGGDHVFVASFRNGEPVAGVKVSLVSRNGTSLFTAVSNNNGEVTFPKASDFTREKEAVLYIAEKDGDLTFLPYQRRDRSLSFSRFDVGGVFNSQEPDALRGLIFTDRGIYRPGEKVQLALTVRNRDLTPLVAELPLTLQISDPRGQVAVRDVLKFEKLGLADFIYETQESGMTGTYRAELIIPARADLPDRILAGVDFRVEEFEPDRLAITASLGTGEQGMFKRLNGLQAKVNLKNLFGVPAAGNNVKATLVVNPWSGELAEYPGFNFRPMLEYQKNLNPKVELGEIFTNESGEAVFNITLSDASFSVLDAVLAAEGFEKESGRSVATTARGLVSDLDVLLGVRSEEALDYVDKGALRRIQLQAINLSAQPTASGNLKMSLDREVYKNVLVKQANGVFKYESTRKLVPVENSDFEVASEGRSLELKTDEPGTYILSFRDSKDVLLNQIRYAVVGEGNDTIRINRNANLELKLNKASYDPGETLELSIKGPYTGFGIITIEREKIFASSWFQTSGTSSVQKIKLPQKIVGNAYISVLLARAWDSKEIYLPPISYAVLPVKINENQYLAAPKLEVASDVKPGAEISVDYTTAEPGSLLVYAVDEGILQFAKYKTPEPLKALLPKRALEVETRTALDLVMPDYSIVQSVLSTGGDEDVDISKFQNPFKKRNRPPLAVWSGIRSVGAGSGQFKFHIPDYFDGSVKVFAYFVGSAKVGFTQSRVQSRGDFVIKPNLPTFSVPGDVFQLGVEVTNTMETEQKTKVSVNVQGLELIGAGEQELMLKPKLGQLAHFKIKTADALGEAKIEFLATSEQASRHISEGISVRPASPLMRTVKYGAYDPEKPGDSPEKKVDGLRDLYPEYRDVQAFISSSPGLFVDSMYQFMQSYPYSCSEQLTSRGFISLLLMAYTESEELRNKLRLGLEKTVRTLSTRMNADGSLAYWRRGDQGDPFASVYAAHFVIDASAQGFGPPHWFFEGIKNYLRTKSQENQFTLDGLFVQAYAIYLRTRLGEVATKELESLVGRLQAVETAKWKGTALSSLIAASYQLLQMPDKVKEYTADTTDTKFTDLPFPLNNVALNAGFINYLRIKHFGGKQTKDILFAILNRLDMEAQDSLSASSLALGMLAGADSFPSVEAFSIISNLGESPLSGKLIANSPIAAGSTELTFKGPKDKHFFYSLVENGYDRQPAKQGSRAQGVSLARDILDSAGNSVNKLKLGETYKVVLRVKVETAVNDFAVQDLLPTGFEPDLEALKSRRSVGGENDAWRAENVDVRDDRLILFGDLYSGTVVFSYPIKPTVKGDFVWPGLYGEAMYNSRIFAWENSTSISVE